ncbi:metallophosphoesterase [Kribbella flavida DSM 17836]|uniref:Metallophosphoesterase n=1 Tax=Kribbella flavida (strain DSM 17836 / JCM 10339 / NBRC 14399) TaxID=479435 RepID=D2PXP9_KRIFD|nr:PQQ-binding-like beta-propeller repeat protein [Kribbella flavida]ADB31691.1 metallophosphoesterase [Kribbella flavida DSM 17836]
MIRPTRTPADRPPTTRWHKLLYGVTGGLAALVIGVPLTGVIADAVDAPSATVTGTVFVDEDADHRQDAGEKPLAGVSVSDGQQIVVTDAQGRYGLTIDVERRNADLVFVTQPAGYSVGTDDAMTPRFWRNLGQLAAGDTRKVNFGLRRDKVSAGGGFTFGNVADPHVNAQLPEQITEINATRQDLAFIQVSGDLTNNATDAEFEFYKASTANSKVPVWPAVGNHEYAAGATYAARIDNYRRHVGPEWYSFDYADRHFLVLENNGAAPFAEQLEWVKADLARNAGRGKRLVVLTHQPMNVPFGSPSVYDEYGKVLEQYRAELILVGHEHSNDVEPNSAFAGTAKHIQTASSSYTIDNSPRGFRFVHMDNKSFDNPFRLYGAEKALTIVSPAPGTSVPLDRFPGIQVNAYDTTDAPVKVRYRLDNRGWKQLRSTGEFTWYADLPGGTRTGSHTLEVEAADKTGATWRGTSNFTLTTDRAIRPAAGADWNQHHGDAAHSGVAAAKVPAGQRLAWSYRTEGTFLTGSPAIVDGVVYVGTRDENGDGNSALHAVELATGRKLWTYPVPSSVHGSVAVSGGLVYVPTLRGTLFAVDAKTGQLKWRNDPQAAPAGTNQRTYGYYGVTVADGKVLFPYQTRFGEAAAGILLALDAKTGRRIWGTPMAGNTMSDGTPAVADGRVYVGNQDGSIVIAYDLATGRKLWTGTDTLGGWQDGVPSAGGGKVYIGSNNGIVARDGATGAVRWSYTSTHPSLVNGGATPSAAAIKDNTVYMSFPSGAVTALDATTGAVIWDQLLPGSLYRGGSFTSPALAGDTLFVGANSGGFYALDALTGQPLWSQNIGTWVSAGPAVSGNTVVAGAFDGNLYAFTPGGPSATPWPVVSGRVTRKADGAPAAATTVSVVRDGAAIGRTTTDAAGNYRVALPQGPGTYTLQVAQLGYATAAREVEVGPGGASGVDLEVSPVAVDASIGKRLPSGLVEGGPADVVIENRKLALAVAKAYNDPQLNQSTTGKVLDLAITGQPDQLDWINLPYVSTAEPVGGNAWQQLQTRSTDVRIVENTGSRAVVRVTGISAEHPGLKIVTTYTATADEQFVTADTTFSNESAAGLSVWAGDAMDHDGPGSRSAVAGFPAITSGGPFSQVPTAKRWIGQAGTSPDNQTYGLVYSAASGPFTGYSQSNFTMSKFKLDLAAGAGHTISRRIVAVSNGGAADKFAVLDQYAY